MRTNAGILPFLLAGLLVAGCGGLDAGRDPVAVAPAAVTDAREEQAAARCAYLEEVAASFSDPRDREPQKMRHKLRAAGAALQSSGPPVGLEDVHAGFLRDLRAMVELVDDVEARLDEALARTGGQAGDDIGLELVDVMHAWGPLHAAASALAEQVESLRDEHGCT